MLSNLHIEELKNGSIEWIHVPRAHTKEIQALRKRFSFHAVDLEESLPPLQRPKIVHRDGYLFMILLYPVFDRDTQSVFSSEVDFFISPNRLVTINSNDHIPALRRLFDACTKTRVRSKKEQALLTGTVPSLLYTLLNELLQETFRMLIHVRQDIDAIEARLFNGHDARLIEEILRVKTNIVNIRQALQGHKTVVNDLITSLSHDPATRRLTEYYTHLLDETKELWDNLQLQRETIDALHQANESLLNVRMNEIMRTLTMLSVLTFPLTLIAATFAMRTKNMPIVDLDGSFWIILGLMFGVVGVMFLFFKKKKWL